MTAVRDAQEVLQDSVVDLREELHTNSSRCSDLGKGLEDLLERARLAAHQAESTAALQAREGAAAAAQLQEHRDEQAALAITVGQLDATLQTELAAVKELMTDLQTQLTLTPTSVDLNALLQQTQESVVRTVLENLKQGLEQEHGLAPCRRTLPQCAEWPHLFI